MKGAMKILGIAVILVVAALGEAKDISGRWVAPFNREGTPVTIVMNLKISGDQITGTVTNARGIEMTIENGKLEGDRISFETNIESSNGRKFNFHYTGEVVEDSIKLRSEVNGQQGNQVLNFHRSEK